MLSLIVLAFAANTQLVASQALRAPTVALSPKQCSYGPADRDTNAQLSWETFDLSAETPKSAMWYSANGCYREAVAAARDYLAKGPTLTVRQHAITMFHMSRNLARTGDNANAALLAAASRRTDQAPNAPLDWNTYVTGFYGYLIGDKPMVEAAREKLVLSGGESNLINASVLARTSRCMDRPFLEVETDTACAPVNALK